MLQELTLQNLKIDGDALSQLRDLAVKAALPKIMSIPGGQPGLSVLARPDGGHELLRAEACPRHHVLETAAALRDFTVAACKGKHGPANPVLWVGDSTIEVTVHDAVRSDRAVLPLVRTPQFQFLVDGLSAKPRSQADMIRMLRIELAGTLTGDTNLLSLLRNVRFNAAQGGDVAIDHGKESMGKKINAEVLGADALPERITLQVRILATPDVYTTQPITCAVDILVHEQLFRLVPLPMQVELALAGTMAEIEAGLRDGLECPIYRGSPRPLDV